MKIDGLGSLAIYPNRDSLSYMAPYKLNDAHTFIRTTLRYPSYCKGWNAIVQSGLANETDTIETTGLTFKKWSEAVLPFVNPENKSMLEFLGLFDEALVPVAAKTSADVLQYLLETKLAMQPADKDMIVMLHEIALIVKGEDSLRTAMAKTVGLPLGIAAKLILEDKIHLTGVHMPILKELYEPVLSELEKFNIIFREEKK